MNNCLKYLTRSTVLVTIIMPIFRLNVDFPPCFMSSKIFYQVDFCVRIVGLKQIVKHACYLNATLKASWKIYTKKKQKTDYITSDGVYIALEVSKLTGLAPQTPPYFVAQLYY